MPDNNRLWVIAEIEETAPLESSPVIPGTRDAGIDTGGGWNSEASEQGSIKGITQRFTRKRISVDAQILKTQMQGMLTVVNDLFNHAESQTGLYLNEVELSVEINAEGQLSLVGNGGKLGNSGGITLKFVRPPQ